MSRARILRLTIVAIPLILVLSLAAACGGATPTPTAVPTKAPTAVPPTAVPVKPTTAPPAPTVAPTAPTKASVNDGCLTCHGVATLVKQVDKETVPLFVDKALFAKSEHAKQECTACHVGFTTTVPHASIAKVYGSWARFSVKNTDVTKTRNYYVVSAEACLACHKDAKYTAFLQSEHATIKDMKFVANGQPRKLLKLTGSDGKTYDVDEDFVANDCERCHINKNCGTCHWKTKITQKTAGNLLDLWTKYDSASDTTKGGLSEYGMDWTVNVASHDFRTGKELAASNEVCQACHIGYYQGDKSVPALGLNGIGVRRHPQVEELTLTIQRGIHKTQQFCVSCHKDVHAVLLKNTEHGQRLEGKTQCVNCHADKGPKTAHKTVTCIGCHDAELPVQIDSTSKMVVPLALKHNLAESWPSHNLVKEVKCTKCHVAGNKVGASASVPAGKAH